MIVTIDVPIDKEVQTRFQAVAAPDEDFVAFLDAAAMDAIARRERKAAGRAEMQAMLDGPRHTAAEVKVRMRLKYGYSDFSHLSHEELEDMGDAILDAMPPEKIAEAKLLGLI